MPDGTPVPVGGGGAPRSVKYIVQTASASLPNAQALAALSTGFAYVTTTTGVISTVGETGTGSVVRATSPTITTPSIASFTNATHDHTNAAGGGVLTTLFASPPAIGGTTPAAVTGTTGTFANLVVAQTATTGSPASEVVVTGAAHTALTASTEYTDVNFNLARTIQFNSGALTTNRSVRFQAPTIGFTSASTLTNAITVSISGAPVAGTNATLTNRAALVVESGNVGIGTLGPTQQLEIVNQATWTLTAFTTYSSGAATHSPQFLVQRARNTEASPQNVQSGDYLGAFCFRGRVTDLSANNALIAAIVDGAPSTRAPARLEFSVGTATATADATGVALTLQIASLSYTGRDAATNSTTNLLTLYHKSSGTPAAGFGTGLLLQADTNGGSQRDMASIRSEWTTAADATRVAKLVFAIAGNTALTDMFVIQTPNSQNPMILGNVGSGFPAIGFGSTMTGSNYALTSNNGTDTYLNSTRHTGMRVNNADVAVFDTGIVTLTDATNIAVGTSTGTKIGTSTSQKLSLWNKTPNVQPTNAIAASTFVANTSGIVDDTATFGGYTLGQIAAALIRIGALA